MDQIVPMLGDAMQTFVLGVSRVVGAMTGLTFLGAAVLGGQMIRSYMAIGFSAVVLPVVYQGIQVSEPNAMLAIGISVKEFLLGILIATPVMVVVWGAQAVGAFIDNQRGLTMASSMDPLVGAQSSPLAQLMTLTLVTVFFVAGLFTGFLGFLYKSYELWPIMTFFPVLDKALFDLLVMHFLQIVKLAVLLGGPIVIAMFLSEFGLGLISRFAPQLNVFFLSMSVKSGVASAMLVVLWGMLVVYFSDLLEQALVALTAMEQLLIGSDS
ncbi:MAG: type III secretion system export apparatus subunit SctT [Gammaproteobacteria bacterium]